MHMQLSEEEIALEQQLEAACEERVRRELSAQAAPSFGQRIREAIREWYRGDLERQRHAADCEARRLGGHCVWPRP